MKIILYNAGQAFVQRDGQTELGFTNNANVVVSDAVSVSAGTNSTVSLSGYREYAIVTVDSGNQVTIIDGPDITGSIGKGIALAMLTVGLILVVRYIVLKYFSMVGIGGLE